MLALLLLFLNYPAFAEVKLTANPDIQATEIYYPQSVSPDNNEHEIITLKVPGTLRFSPVTKFHFNPEVSVDPNNASTSERFFADPNEAYFQWQKNPVTVQVGWNTFTWGDTDVYNPLDIINPRRYQDPIRSEKLGSPAAFIRWEHGVFSAEGLYIVHQRESVLPGTNSRWLPRDVYQSRSIGTSFGTATVDLPSNVNYNFVDPVEMNNALSNNFGARLKAKLPGLDMSLIGYQGVSTAPVVGLHEITVNQTSYSPLTFVVAPNVYLQATYYKTQVAGFSFVKVLGDFLLKGESAFQHAVSKRDDLPKDGFDNVLALERSFDIGENSLTTTIEGTYADHNDPLDNGVTSLSRMFDRSALIGARYTIGSHWTLLASYLRDIKFQGNFFRGELTWQMLDALSIDLTADVLGGSVGTPLGTYAKNDRGILSLDFKF